MNPDTPRPYEDIAERLKWHREEIEQRTQVDYATRIGASGNRLANWESGTSRLSLDGALALHRRFGLSLDWLYLGEDGAMPLTLRKAWRDHLHDKTDTR